jgi:hypothetical protein
MAKQPREVVKTDDELTINMRQELLDLPPELDSLDASRKEMLVILCHLWPNITSACGVMGISRQTFYNWKESDDLFAEAVQQLHEARLDNIESKVHDIAMGNTQYTLTACIFLLNTQRSERFQQHSKVKHTHTMEIADPMDMKRYEMKQLPDNVKEVDISPNK